MLASYGFQIHEASSGTAAIELVKKNQYDMIFMDHMMPEMDGMETTRIIQSECKETADNAIIVALTANAIQGAREMYLENGFKDFLSKPFERIQMHELLNRWIPKNIRDYQESEVQENKVSEDEMAEIFMSGVNVRKAVMSKELSIDEYLTLLKQFREDGEIKRPLLCKLVQEKEYQQYGEELDILKGTATDIGAENLSEEVKKLQKAVEEKNYEYIDFHYAQMIVNYERVTQEIARVLKRKI